jgi:CRP/FNR family transcriptional regulator
VQVDAEGYEQVLGFALHADMIGLDGMSRGRHASGAVALEDSTVATRPFAEVMSALHVSRRLPNEQPDKVWQDIYNEFKTS